MLFNSYIFIFLFLPLALVGYFAINHTGKYRLASLFLLGMSLWFYGYFNPYYLWIICASIIGNYAFSRGIILCTEKKTKKAITIAGIAANIILIFYYKYLDFFVENVNALFHQDFTLRNIVLPLGISFFTFQQISYLVDSYRGMTKDYDFIEYALFVAYFPQLIAGPIVLHNETIPQFRDLDKRKINSNNIAKGIYVFALGLFKKVLIADTFGRAVSWGYGQVDTLSSIEGILVTLAYTFQLYFDFSGYCDMAIGIGNMFNIDIPCNFNSPYKSVSIIEFWDRWHITLNRFLRVYIYFPLGGSRKGKVRTYINIMIVFLISGLWHGANWTFVVWGALHGVADCLNRLFIRGWDKVHKAIRWIITFGFVNFAWIFFRADSVKQACVMISRIGCMDSVTISETLTTSFKLTEFAWLEKHLDRLASLSQSFPGLYMWLFFVTAFVCILFAKNSSEIEFKPTIARGISAIVMLVWGIMSLSGVSTFLYFNF